MICPEEGCEGEVEREFHLSSGYTGCWIYFCPDCDQAWPGPPEDDHDAALDSKRGR